MVTDIYEDPNKMEERLVQINNIKVPTLLLLNKIDLSNQKTLEAIVSQWKLKLPNAQILPISALHKMSINFILPKILEWLPNYNSSRFKGDFISGITVSIILIPQL